MRTGHLSLVTQEHSDTPSVKPNVSSPFGPVRAGLTTSQITQDQRLSELLSSLESVVENLSNLFFIKIKREECINITLLPFSFVGSGLRARKITARWREPRQLCRQSLSHIHPPLLRF